MDEWIVSVIKAMYDDATTTVIVNGRESKAFSVRVGVHQGSVLSPLRIQESIHVACASRVLVIIPLSALLATNGFIKGVVVFRVDWGMLLISAAEGVWMVTLLR